MDSECGSGINDKHSRRNAKANGNKGDVHSLADSVHERGNSRHPRRDPETAASEGKVAPAKKYLKSSSSGSPSSDISSEEFILMDPKIIFKPNAAATTYPNDVHPLPTYYKIEVSSDISSKSEHDSGWSTGGTSQVSDLTHESPPYSTSLIESPPIQVMERPAGFDPNRIPNSVFASKSAAPMEWSVASNESLFSLKIGNSSFSRDHVVMSSGELHKSGELYKSEELPKFEGSFKSSELISFSPPPLVVRGRASDKKNVNMGRNFGETGVAADETIKVASTEIAIDQSKENLHARELSFNLLANACQTCTQSVEVPPKKKKHACSSCHCSNCSFAFCCSTPNCCLCKWPSCNFCKRPSCSCCKWPSCNCCTWPSCRCCKLQSCRCCKLPSCSGCRWPSCSCCKRPSCSCCKWPSCSCFTRPSCSCCKWPSCSWPSCRCCCKWPSCSSCSWASCCGLNSRQKKIFCCSSDVSTGEESMQRHSGPKASRGTPKPAFKKWFSCFYCCSNSC